VIRINGNGFLKGVHGFAPHAIVHVLHAQKSPVVALFSDGFDGFFHLRIHFANLGLEPAMRSSSSARPSSAAIRSAKLPGICGGAAGEQYAQYDSSADKAEENKLAMFAATSNHLISTPWDGRPHGPLPYRPDSNACKFELC
jgi:hypothetical protein